MQLNDPQPTWWHRWKPTPQRPTSPLVWYILAVLALVIAAAALSLLRNSASGSLSARGVHLGTFTLHAQGCNSGERDQFHGVVFYDYGQRGFAGRIVLPEAGDDHIAVNVPGQHAEEVFHRSECSVWDVDVHNGLSYANNIRTVKGHARFTCARSDGSEAIQGNLQFRACH